MIWAALGLEGELLFKLECCTFGGPSPNKVRVTSNIGAMKKICRSCDGNHKHGKGEGAVYAKTGKWAPVAAQLAYPKSLCCELADALIEELRSK